ncbi:hypothetical protein WBP07_22110 (plasmid) [Novosphingobium sp. BL-8A]|uniref:hypothetical protein n=1 Tax=Novosphingobium sp. BL-8A TaxID=3127639 RepID=UPI0037578BDE
MRFWASAEVYQPAFFSLDRARRCVEGHLNTALNTSVLADADIELGYIPIVMPADMRKEYPQRSRASIRKRTYTCAPQLDYDVFVTGAFEEQILEYLRGLSQVSAHLPKFGFNSEQVAAFDTILSAAFAVILNKRPDQTRH